MRAALLLAVLWLGCAGKPPVTPEQAARATLCDTAIRQHIAHEVTCPEAQMAIDSDPACADFHHLNLNCKEFRQ